MKRIALTIVVTLASNSSYGALIDRGGGLIYDTDLDITWLQDANYAKTSGFSPDGGLTWIQASNWVAGLNYFDSVRGVTWDDWRLPITVQPDPSCQNQDGMHMGIPAQGFGPGCTGSELGHLNNVDAVSWLSPGPFQNVTPIAVWSATDYAPNSDNAWVYLFSANVQTWGDKDGINFAWAVRDGDVIPIPHAIWLFASSLALLIGINERRK